MKNLTLKNPRAFTLVELMIVIAILGVILSLAVPAYNKTRYEARKKICITNLSEIEASKQIWGMEKSKTTGDIASIGDLVGPQLYMKRSPDCPAAGLYDYGAIGTAATCTIEGHTLSGN